MPFYTENFGCREVSKPDIFLDGFDGELAFTDVHVLIYPGSAPWPEPGVAVNARGYTGSWAWWQDEPCGSLPPLGQLGWRGPHRYDDPEVHALRCEHGRVTWFVNFRRVTKSDHLPRQARDI